MEKLVVGDVVVVPFPFTNLEGAKRRPALVLVNWGTGTIFSAKSRAAHSPSRFLCLRRTLRRDRYQTTRMFDPKSYIRGTKRWCFSARDTRPTMFRSRFRFIAGYSRYFRHGTTRLKI